MPEKFPQGRPTKYTQDLDNRVIELMANGDTFRAAAYRIGIAESTAYDWCDKNSPRFKKSFSEAKKTGEQAFEAWLMDHFKEGMWFDKDRVFNTTAAIWLSKAVCKWKDTESSSQANVNFTISYDPKRLDEGMLEIDED